MNLQVHTKDLRHLKVCGGSMNNLFIGDNMEDNLRCGFEYKGEKFQCRGYSYELLSDEEFNEIVRMWNTLPDKSEVLAQMKAFHRGNNNINKIVKYYYRPIMDQVRKYFDKWSVSDVFECKDMCSMFIARVKKNPKVFSSDSIIENLDTAFRLGGKGVASKVSNFPVDVCDRILRKYNVNNNYYDFSCGWGVRQMCAMRNEMNYYGTDPNYKLVEKLNEFNQDYKQVNNTLTDTKIYCQGSQKFIPELENKIGIAFSSPPYFDLEDYKFGDQSFKPGTTYKQWVDDYLKPTFANIYKYLVHEGYFIVNIKDFNGVPLEQTTIDTAQEVGFKLYKVEQLSQGKRLNTTSDEKGDLIVDSSENIYIFVKKDYDPKEKEGLFGYIDEDDVQNQIIQVGTTTRVDRETKEEIVEEKTEFIDLW